MTFNEPLNTAVFTTTHVVRNNSPIVYVSHDEDGSWQFFGNEPVSVKDAMVVGLGEIISLDKTILQIADLSIGFSAHRDSQKNKWEIITNKESV
jgi:hypothetical protein